MAQHQDRGQKSSSNPLQFLARGGNKRTVDPNDQLKAVTLQGVVRGTQTGRSIIGNPLIAVLDV